MGRYLGSKPVTNFCTANNALAGTGGMRQPVHKDITFHHPLVSSVECFYLAWHLDSLRLPVF